MIRADSIRLRDRIGLFPEEIDDIDGPRFLVNPEDGSEPALLSDRGMLDAKFHPLPARLDAEPGWVGVETQFPRQIDAGAELRLGEFLCRPSLNNREGKDRILL